MIAWMKGVLLDKRPPLLLVEVNGVGYELEAPMTTFGDLPGNGEEIALFVHQVVREDAHQLYAFSRARERDVFRMLLKVNGVGAKLGLAILSGMNADELSRTIHEGDTGSLSRLPGIGKKTAERLVIEMRDRLDKAPDTATADPAGTAHRPSDPIGEAVSALVALGLKPPEASRRVSAIDATGLACEEIVRIALQSMVR